MRNLVFDIHEVIDDEKNLDVWVVYQSEKDLENAYSLHKLLWKVHFDPRKVVKNYQLEHTDFYRILNQGKDGKAQLANLILQICVLLKNIADTGAMYGNLRTENIIIKMSRDKKKIE